MRPAHKTKQSITARFSRTSEKRVFYKGGMPERIDGMSDQTAGTGTQGSENGKAQVDPITWEAFIGSQDETIQGLYNSDVSGLKNTITATRTERDQFAQELRDAAAKLEKGSDAEKQLTELVSKLEVTEQRLKFAEEAPGKGCTNIKAAYLLAKADNLFDRKGGPDWVAIKEAAPELFKTTSTNSGAGSGTGQQPATAFDMDKIIRQAVGK